MAPFLCSFFSFTRNELKDEKGWLDYFVLTSMMSCRALIIIGFMYHITYETKKKHVFLWALFYSMVSIIYLGGLITYWVY